MPATLWLNKRMHAQEEEERRGEEREIRIGERDEGKYSIYSILREECVMRWKVYIKTDLVVHTEGLHLHIIV